MIVELKRTPTTLDGEPKTVATVRMTDAGVEIEGDASSVDFLRSFELVEGGEVLSVEDGEAWIRALPRHLRGSLSWAVLREDETST